MIITDNIKNCKMLYSRKVLAGESFVGETFVTPTDEAIDIMNSLNANAKKGLVPAKLIDSNTGAIFIDKIMRENEYNFCPKESLCKKTCIEILNNINLIGTNDREFIIDKELQDKFEELLDIRGKFNDITSQNGFYTEERLFYEASTVLDGAIKTTIDNGESIDVIFFDKKRSKSEKEFLCALEKNIGKKFNYIDPETLVEKKEIKAKAVKCFGLYNEVDYVNNDIAKNKYKYGDIEILYTSDDILPYIKAIFGENGIKTTIISSHSALNNKYLKLIIDLVNFAKNGFIYEDLKNVCFNKLININNIGSMFLSGINWGIGFYLSQYKQFVENVKNFEPEYEKDPNIKIVKLFNEGYIDFIKDLIKTFDIEEYNAKKVYGNILSFVDKYTKNQNIDKNIIKSHLIKLINEFSYRDNFDNSDEVYDFILEELKNVTSSDEESNDNISVKKLDNFYILNRKHIYIVGLSSKHYDISNTESPVLSDEDRIKLFGDDFGSVTLRSDAPKQCEESILKTIRCLNAETLTFSMSDYSTLEFMPISESNLYKKLCEEYDIKDSDIEVIDKYNHIVDKDYKFDITRLLKEKIDEDDDIENTEELAKPTDEGYIDTSDKSFEIRFSKSSLDNFKDCILHYHYSKEAYINEEAYASPKEDEWLAANERGTFAHSVLELYANKVLINKKVKPTVDEEEFNKIFENVRKDTVMAHPIDSRCMAESFITDCKKHTLEYLKRLHKELSSKDNKWKVISTEQKFGYDDKECLKEYKINDKTFKIRYHGYIDRIDGYKDSNGKLHVRLIDYKTGSKGNFDAEHTTQHHIYSLFCSEKNIVDEFRYEFIFDEIEKEDDGVTIISKDNINDPIEHFNLQNKLYDVFVNHKYDVDNIDDSKEGGDICKYCNYNDICLKKVK